MSLLTLKDIGKIYVSKSVVSIGIRGVNLSFDRGEFVAITGKSGSGKSTLLNVISGMDTYEEGELLIENSSTQYYTQKEWEEYREKYISFIFQDYNIIESCTVLQNVELALFHIANRQERRKRAIELLERVGLSNQLHQKASKLSGGQKQRTVIARALAKDSPIILADEPTGNLDSATSKEIIQLLKEVSVNKLCIIVTHNFDEVEEYATRHVRIFDGGVEYDHVVKPNESTENHQTEEKVKDISTKISLKNSFTLGKTIFTSRPKLSTFMCAFLIVAILILYGATIIVKEFFEDLNYQPTYFTPSSGRVIITTPDGSPISDETLTSIQEKTNAKDAINFDFLLDDHDFNQLYDNEKNETSARILRLDYEFQGDYGKNIYGRYPEKINEVFLYLPIGSKVDYSPEELLNQSIILEGNGFYDIVGVKYFRDNRKKGKALLTREGFDVLNRMVYLNYHLSSSSVNLSINQTSYTRYLRNFAVTFTEEKKVYVNPHSFEFIEESKPIEQLEMNFNFSFVQNDYDYQDDPTFQIQSSLTFSSTDISTSIPTDIIESTSMFEPEIVLSLDVLEELAQQAIYSHYHQASLFYKNNRVAKDKINTLKDMGYIVSLSNAKKTYLSDSADVFIEIMGIAIYLMFIVSAALFIYACTAKSFLAFKSDISIFRSMGIKTKEIKIAMLFRMLICLIPSFIFFAILSILFVYVPILNRTLPFFYLVDYLLIIFGMIFVSLFVTSLQLKKLYKISVKESLKGEIE